MAGSLTSHASIDDEDGGVYTILGTTTPANGTKTILWIQNDSSEFILVPDRVYVEAVGITGIPTSSIYISLGFDRTYSSGGTTATPININRTSTKTADVTAKYDGPTLSGTFVESHRWYPDAASAASFDMIVTRANDMVLGRTDTMEIQVVSNSATGTVLALVKFMMSRQDHMP